MLSFRLLRTVQTKTNGTEKKQFLFLIRMLLRARFNYIDDRDIAGKPPENI